MIVKITSKKFGNVEFLIDEEEYKNLEGYTFYAWTTERHTGIYVNCYSPDDRNNPKRLHRIIMKAKKNEIVDHIDRNPLNNQKSNLRIVSSRVNNNNASKRKDGVSSKYKGVHQDKYGKWIAQIQVEGKKIRIGKYLDEISAALAYDEFRDKNNIDGPKNIANNIADLK